MTRGFRWMYILWVLALGLAVAAAAYATSGGSSVHKASGRNITRTVKKRTLAPGDVDGATAFCPAGRRIVSGGFITAGVGVVFTSDSFGGNGWSVGYDNSSGVVSASVKAVAYCAPSGSSVHASRAPTEGSFRAAIRRQRNAHN
jgi:hypothetical protein